ncbi:cytochrome P450 [Mycena sanguinolenta]|nr:cytochrome P450 [Mycena sanguinolenta]
MGISLLLAFVALCVFVCLRKVGSREAGLPPGPPTVPLLGNLHMMPTEFAQHKFTEWARKYGGIYSLKVGSGTAVVLTDPAAVKELMDKRSGSTVERPRSHLVDLVTEGLHMAFAHYTENWRTLRRTAHAILTPQASARLLPIQQAEASQLLHDILRHPQARRTGFYTHIRRYSNSVILSVLYGKRSPRYETPKPPRATPPIDMIPILKYVPERWAKWKRDCAKVHKMHRDLYFGLLDETKERLRRGEENGSYMEEILTRQQEFGMDRELTGYLGGVLIEGGSDTISAFLQSLILALTAYPDAQKKAHDEMDRVVGEHRMPGLKDLDEMPYIRTMILETHRFRPVLPLIVPHSTVTAEECNGFVIPQGATIFVNVCEFNKSILVHPSHHTESVSGGIFHDPNLYDDPENFIPDRYLLTEHGTKPGVDDSDMRPNLAFGVGRRACPGIHVAQNSTNINAMNIIWAFNFTPATDECGTPIKPDIFDYEKGLSTAPRPFKCNITPRSPERVEIIEREFREAADTFSKFEYGLDPEDQEFVANSRRPDSR